MIDHTKKIKIISAISAVFFAGIVSLPFLTYADTPKNMADNPVLETADQVAAETTADFSVKTRGMIPPKTPVTSFSDLTLVFSGVALILLSMGITVLLISQNNEGSL